MPVPLHSIFICLHALVAWILVEMFVNLSHRLARPVFIVSHYIFVAFAFSALFFLYNRFFVELDPFSTMAIAMLFVFFLEVLVFRFLYSGERWFLNYVDWIVPIFIAATAIYFTSVMV